METGILRYFEAITILFFIALIVGIIVAIKRIKKPPVGDMSINSSPADKLALAKGLTMLSFHSLYKTGEELILHVNLASANSGMVALSRKYKTGKYGIPKSRKVAGNLDLMVRLYNIITENNIVSWCNAPAVTEPTDPAISLAFTLDGTSYNLSPNQQLPEGSIEVLNQLAREIDDFINLY